LGEVDAVTTRRATRSREGPVGSVGRTIENEDRVGDDDAQKARAAQFAADLVEDGMTVGLGTGSTVAYLLPALAKRHLDLVCVATSPATQEKAEELGLNVVDFSSLKSLDLAIDGADEVDPEGWLIKGGGGAHTREKIVAAASERYVVIVSENKVVDQLKGPVPLELSAFGLAATLAHLGEAHLRSEPPSPDGGLLGYYDGPITDLREVARWLDSVPGVIAHGLFPPTMVTDIVIGRDHDVERRSPKT